MTWQIQVCVLHPDEQVFEQDGCSVCNPRDRKETVVVQTTTVEVVSGKTALKAWEITDEANEDSVDLKRIAEEALDRCDKLIAENEQLRKGQGVGTQELLDEF